MTDSRDTGTSLSDETPLPREGDGADEYFMREAMKEAEKAAALGEVPVGAVMVSGNVIIARGHNHMISSNDPSAHAEIMAIRAAGRVIGNYRMTDTVLYVTLEPCIMCSGAIIHARIGRVVYGARDYKTGGDVSVFNILQDLRHNHHPVVVGGVLEEECSSMISAFFAGRRAQKKQEKLEKRQTESGASTED
ncbi:tRNA adenosine(34) deaminase TadA [Ruminobacter sp.]|uniref:tRNA adenosine(34) deaminase TadA n=1 Tax=Ruminobacter sp. TaxID=2774296 RepID=UPI0025E9D393|nr:tRNA adenosine(34) deaminase TadA [Ruminobacter sp.]